jgi:L,D-transpeptidase ErfK/SrfK
MIYIKKSLHGKYRINPLVTVFALVLPWLACSPRVYAETFILPPADVDVIGQITYTEANRDNTLLDIARRYDIGQDEIMLANPTVDRWLPADHSKVLIPNRYILPRGDREGIIVNLPEMRLYYFPKPKAGERPVLITHPISVGRMNWRSPLGKTSIVSKLVDPPWVPPESIKKEALADGRALPDVVPGGEGNPLGRFALRLGVPGYLIHGTEKEYGIGMRVTHGCMRLYPEDIEGLFANVPVGTPVLLVNQPIKVGWMADGLFVELHPPLEEDADEYQNYMQRVLDAVADTLAKQAGSGVVNSDRSVSLNGEALRKAVEEKSGIPVLITR